MVNAQFPLVDATGGVESASSHSKDALDLGEQEKRSLPVPPVNKE